METRADRRTRRRRELSLLLHGDRTEYGHRRKIQKDKARPAALRHIHRYGSAAIRLWSATPAWFTAYPGPRVGAETAVTAVTAYQEDMLPPFFLCIIPMVPTFGIHFVMLLIGRTRYPRRMLLFHPVTWMSVMSQSSTNTAIVIRRAAAAIYEKRSATPQS